MLSEATGQVLQSGAYQNELDLSGLYIISPLGLKMGTATKKLIKH